MPGEGGGQTSLPYDTTKEGRIREWKSLNGFREGGWEKGGEWRRVSTKIRTHGEKIIPYRNLLLCKGTKKYNF